VEIKNGESPGIGGSQRTAPAESPALDKGRKATSHSVTEEADRVSVDTHQAVLAKLLDPSASTNSSKAAELQRLYASGQYSVDAAAVSRSLIESVLAGE
jgi:anti-sigma28 factor (negative regulator of flagellin synthesis)